MDLRQIKYFATVARSGSFLRASEVLHVSQPALSVQIRRLEETHGVRLLQRHSRGVVLTGAGARFLTAAERVLNECRDAAAVLESLKSTEVEVVSLGLTPTAGRIVAPGLLDAVQSRARLQLVVHEGNTVSLTEQVLAGKLDMAVCYDLAPREDLPVHALADDHLMLIGPPSRLRDADGPIRFEELARYPLVLNSRPNVGRRFIESIAEEAGVRLDVAFEVEALNVKRELLNRGFCTINPIGAFIDEIREGRLQARRIIEPPLILPLIMIVRGEAPHGACDAVKHLVLEIVSGAIESGEVSWQAPDRASRRPAQRPLAPSR